ncbi:MAG: catalase, partial [Pseudomonadota bacterium]|nr:catalase [Pseudomonadota bacterium]
EELSPFFAVARIRVPRQHSWVEGESTREEDRLAFSPWHGLAAHRPLGSINRARRTAYESLASFRRTRNGCPMHEPAGQA